MDFITARLKLASPLPTNAADRTQLLEVTLRDLFQSKATPEENRGKWAVVWELGTDVLWWVDDSDVGKMTLTDPARVIVDREGRVN